MIELDEMLDQELVIETESRGTEVIVILRGTVGTPEEVDRVERALSMACLRRPKVLVIDLSELAFISALGIGALVQWHRLIEARVGPVRFVDPQPMVMDMLRRLGLHKIFEIHCTVEAAIMA